MDTRPTLPAALDGLDPILLDKYCAGTCRSTELRDIETWVAGRPDRKAALAGLRAGLVSPVYPAMISGPDMNARLGAVLGASPSSHGLTRANSAGRGVVALGRLGKQTLQRLIVSAGAVITATVAVFLISYRASGPAEVTRAYATSSGQQATFTLNDGTRVTLAPNTTLRLVRFGSSSRTVDLDGQAYFEVAHAAGTPFLVRTGSIATQVLGTAFLVRHYTTDEKVHVAVAKGKVKIVSSAGNRWPMSSPLTLTQGHAGDVTDSTVLVNTVDLTPETDWLRGRLVFRHAPLVEVLRTLSRWYGYQFRCNDSVLTHESVTLALNSQSSAEALSTLEQLLSVHLTIVGDTVTLTPQTGGASKGSARKQVYDVWIPTREVGR